MANKYAQLQKRQISSSINTVIKFIELFRSREILKEEVPDEEFDKLKQYLHDFAERYLRS
jgi:selenocysteine-specific translation elongation factor